MIRPMARRAVEAPADTPGRGSADPLIGDLRRAGVLPLLVLHYAAREPSYGNQLMDRIAELTDGALVVNPNTMYPLLHALEARGLLEGALGASRAALAPLLRHHPGGRGRARAARGGARPAARPDRPLDRHPAQRGARLMGRAAATVLVPGRVSDAEALWYDPVRWAAWVDGFGHVVELAESWPATGARLVWDAPPGGRGA